MLRIGRSRKTHLQEQPWDGIQGADDWLPRQSENRIFTLLWKAMIVYCIVGGGMGCLLSSLDVDYHVVTVQAVILGNSIFLALLYYHRLWENIGYILFFIGMVFAAYLLRNYINSGFYGVMNDMAEAVSEYFDTSAMRSYGERVGNRSLAITISMAYIGIVGCLVINISVSRRMQYLFSVLAVIGGLFLPLYLELEPSLFFVVQLLWGLFMASSVRRSKHYALRMNNIKYERKKNQYTYVYSIRTMMQLSGCCLLVVGVVAMLLTVIMPKDTYHDRHPAGQWKKQTEETVENLSMLGIAGLFNFYDNVGGLTSGRLGGVSALRLDYETDLMLTFVPTSEQRFYLRQFVGKEYVPVSNHWERDSDLTNEVEQAMQKAYESGNPYMGKGRILVENVAGQSTPYLPYYSTEFDKLTWTGRSQEYTYYTDFGSENQQLEEALRRKKEKWWQYLDVPEEDKAAVNQVIKDAELSYFLDTVTNVSRLASYYQEEIPYSYQPGITPYGEDFVTYFLSVNRKGYCAHFASAATLIFRELGIPARYVEGYAIDPDDISEDGQILAKEDIAQYYQGYSDLEQTAVVQVDVTDASAHAWVEIWFNDKGWQIVDVTPASSQEEPGQGLWSTFMRFFRNGSNRSALQDRETASTAGVTAARAENVVKTVLKIIVILLILAGLVLMLWWLLCSLRQYIRNRGKSRNDRLIGDYQRYVRKMEHQIDDFDQLQNYEEQIQTLVLQGKLTLTDLELKHMISLLEQAGFGSREITAEEDLWIRRKIHNKKI